MYVPAEPFTPHKENTVDTQRLTTVEAGAIVLKDAAGQVKARLGIDGNGFPSLQLYGLRGEAGGALAELGFYAPDDVAGETEGHPVLSMADGDKALRVSLSRFGLELVGPEPQPGEPGPRVTLRAPDAEDVGGLTIADDDGIEAPRHVWPEPVTAKAAELARFPQ